MSCDVLWSNIHVATMNAPPGSFDGYGVIEDAALAITNGKIAWVGPRAELPADLNGSRLEDGEGCWVTPGLIDCHTHLVYSGDRALEFESRLLGKSYAEIAEAGGGIALTVAATRDASESELVRGAAKRLAGLLADGVTTVEIKSGYGLTVQSELKMLRAARELARREAIAVSTTLLAAHAVPPEYRGRDDDYITLICEELIPQAAREGLADAVDAFCETLGFSAAQTRRVFECARQHHLPVKLHADQLSDSGGAALAAAFGAWSADHLEYTSGEGVAALARSGTSAVLLPGAFYFLRETKLPPLDLLRHHGVPIAIATDCNPGSSPCTSLLLMLNMACTLFRMTPAESLAGVTRAAAGALGQGEQTGRIAVGLAADLALWDVRHPRELCYAFGSSPLVARVFRGERCPH